MESIGTILPEERYKNTLCFQVKLIGLKNIVTYFCLLLELPNRNCINGNNSILIIMHVEKGNNRKLNLVVSPFYFASRCVLCR